MNAIQPARPPLYPVEPVRKQAPRPRRRLRQRRNPHQSVAVEASLRLAVNVVVGMVAIASIVRLLPQNVSQQQQLNQLQSDVTELEQRVDRLQETFARQFDAGQTRSVMQEETGRIGIGQRPVVWVKTAPDAAIAPGSASASANPATPTETALPATPSPATPPATTPVTPPDITPVTPLKLGQPNAAPTNAVSYPAPDQAPVATPNRAVVGPWAW
ncbi:slr1601 family putative cell division protein [Thermoleptolyngbya sp.]